MAIEQPELSAKYRLVAEANRRMYDGGDYADEYVEKVLVGAEEQKLLTEDFKRALDVLGDLGRPVRALDCCGGAGNGALLLHELGCEVELADISSVMIEHYKAECARRGYPARTHCGEIATFFAQCREPYDLMVFSSCLHHLEDPVLVLEQARRALTPGGVIVTMFDPIRLARWRRMLLEPARLIDAAVANPRMAFTRAVPVIKRLLRGGGDYKQRSQSLELDSDNTGNIAEYHADTGFDDRALVVAIQHRAGLETVNHDRYVRTCGPVQNVALRLLGTRTSFRLLLRKAR